MIIIDPGHGGSDPGGGTNSLFKEKNMNLKISKYQKRRFDELGIDSILTRDIDTTLNPNERVQIINNLDTNNAILISNHINNGVSNGGEVIYSIKENSKLPFIIGENLQKNGVKIRNIYKKTGKTGKDYYFILRNSNVNNGNIIEYGFASNDKDAKMLNENWINLAESVVESIAKYLNKDYQKKEYRHHVVNENDSLFKIAKKYNVSIEKIKELNALDSNELIPGTLLILE